MAFKRSSYSPRQQNRHLSRWIRSRQGLADEDIARKDGVKVETVRASIQAIEAQRMLHTPDFANQGIVEALVENKDDLTVALKNGLTAEKEYIDNETGKSTKLPDVTTQLEAVDKYTKLATVVQKKEFRQNTQVNVGLAVGARGGPPTVGGYIGVEDRIRKLHEEMESQKQLTQTSEVVAPPEAGEEEEYSVDSQ